MGRLEPINDAAVEAARILRNLERKLRRLMAQASRASRRVGSGETSSSMFPPESPVGSPGRNSRFPPMPSLKKFAPKSPLGHLKLGPESPLASPKRLLATLSNKAAPFLLRKKVGEEEEADGALWQREILMGEKCQPLDFSGVIYYDRNGKPLSAIPPRSPLRGGGAGNRPLVQSFSFPAPSLEKKGD